MRLLLLAPVLTLAACSQASTTTALTSPAGQLFCALQSAGGGQIVVGLIDAEASAAAPSVAPVAVLATGAAKAVVDKDCAIAGASVGGTGIAVSPPTGPVANVAVTPAKS